MTSQLTKLRNAGADVIIWYSSSPETASLMISRQKIGWDVPMVGPWAASGSVFPKLAGKAGAGLHLVQSFTPDQSDKANQLDEKIKAKYGEEYVIPVVAAQTYDATWLILKALDQVGPDPEKIRDAIENMDNFDSVVGFPSKPFTKEKHDAIDRKSMFMAKYDENLKIVKAK
jgi:branched-chain amino acid transport system substrate-binding protein